MSAREAPRTTLRIWSGHPYPLGATWDGNGVNLAVFSLNAEGIDLCLFDRDGQTETARIPLPEYTDEVWHGYFPDLRPGQFYGLRAHGPWEPEIGHRFNANKLLLDPYARQIAGAVTWNDALFGYTIGHPDADLSFDTRDSAPFMPRCVIVDSAFTWGEDRAPRRPWADTIVYEAHVRGMTKLHPGVEPSLRGTFAGLGSAAVIDYLRDLGITSVELLPVHASVDHGVLAERGLVNHWGYDTLAFFAPHPRYLSGRDLAEFKSMVRGLHEAGLELLLDVVFNHTAEGNHLGPTLSFRGLDNATYYRLSPENRRYYVDFTGCGNTFNLHQPRALQLVMDSLRYWVEEMHVDGFRFDLATVLARESDGEFDRNSGFLDVVRQDPVLSKVKLIAEPWDLGPGGYRLGSFPPGWAEWNDRYRDTTRSWWAGHDALVGEMASRVTGSSDIFDHDGRCCWASVNFITAHDGFTLRDLVSYDRKHNEANGEDNRDGTDANHSWNCGAEGPTDDPAILALRGRQQRNFLATLLLSQGLPMMLAGDECGHSKQGNNNTYCQDNELEWIDWASAGDTGAALTRFVRRVIALRQEYPVFRRYRFFHGQSSRDDGFKDIAWLRPDAQELTEEDWATPFAHSLAFVLGGHGQHPGPTEIDRPEATFFIILNASHEAVDYTMPDWRSPCVWLGVIDTGSEDGEPDDASRVPGDTCTIPAHTLMVFRCRGEDEFDRKDAPS